MIRFNLIATIFKSDRSLLILQVVSDDNSASNESAAAAAATGQQPTGRYHLGYCYSSRSSRFISGDRISHYSRRQANSRRRGLALSRPNDAHTTDDASKRRRHQQQRLLPRRRRRRRRNGVIGKLPLPSHQHSRADRS